MIKSLVPSFKIGTEFSFAYSFISKISFIKLKPSFAHYHQDCINLNFIVFSADFCIVKSMFRIRKSSDEGIIDAMKFAKIVIRM